MPADMQVEQKNQRGWNVANTHQCSASKLFAAAWIGTSVYDIGHPPSSFESSAALVIMNLAQRSAPCIVGITVAVTIGGKRRISRPREASLSEELNLHGRCSDD
jgi:hypothetical protein